MGAGVTKSKGTLPVVLPLGCVLSQRGALQIWGFRNLLSEVCFRADLCLLSDLRQNYENLPKS